MSIISYFRNKKKEQDLIVDKLMVEAFSNYQDPIEEYACPSCGKYVCINENCNR